MPYYLKHYFNPDFDHFKLRPKELDSGRVDHYELGYVQNAVKAEVLAQWLEVDEQEAGDLDPKFLYKNKKFPMGPGTEINPLDEDQLLSTHNGYVFYSDDGLITVKRIMNVRRDMDFSTGNILFVGDLVIHGSVKSGFRLQAANALVKKTIEGARLSAMGSIVCEGGVKGGGQAVIQAGESIRVHFAENATLEAGENVLVDTNAMHNTIFAGQKLSVKGRMVGGCAHCYKTAVVTEQIGGGLSTTTRVVLGKDPMLVMQSQALEKKVEFLEGKVRHYRAQVGKGEDFEQEYGLKLSRTVRKLALTSKKLERMNGAIHDTARLDSCKLLVPGEIRPGVEVSIGPATLKVQDFLRDVRFVFKDGEVVCQSPAFNNK